VSSARRTVLICDEDRFHTQTLAAGLEQLGYAVEVVRTYAEAFAIACAHDIDALVVAPFLKDGSALVLPSALGIRKPPVAVLITRMTERIANVVAQRVGFDAQITKCVTAETIHRLVESAAHRAPAEIDQRVRTSTSS
jgi:DNA-binding response OmpR family regulator